ncbi:uncharacterized protein LOC120706738 [Panicum virgatum]|uniref:uncharacterized protein LOC120706738 n=1 Tax=Panicum virgatum TaxID=38727 RepID=UPI0019D5BC49|nr:uncharacterized protein LOC120706738 [Panicum virgatum]
MERVASSCTGLLSQRRGYSVAAVVVKGTGRMVVEKVAKRVMGKEAMNTAAAAAPAEKAPWVPDPSPATTARRAPPPRRRTRWTCAPSCFRRGSPTDRVIDQFKCMAT